MRRVVITLACLTMIAFVGVALAFEGNPIDIEKTGMIAGSESAGPGGATFGNFALSVQVDRTVCAGGGVQCGTPGHTREAAGPTNHNPVRLVIQVLHHGQPVIGNPSENFTVDVRFVPAGASTLERLDCADCFQTDPTTGGIYAIWVHPAVAGFNWFSGMYAVQVRVKNPTTGRIHRALARIDIPFPSSSSS